MGNEEEELQELYDYVDEVPLSRPKKNIARDFADGVLVAELVNYEQPRIIELHNYSSANSIPQKLYNWNTLNHKVFKHHLHFSISKADIEAVCSCKTGAIERILQQLRGKLDQYKKSQQEILGDEHYRDDQVNSTSKQTGAIKPVLPKGDQHQAGHAVDELRETNELLTVKISKLEQLLKLKDAKIQSLTGKLGSAGQQKTESAFQGNA